MTMGSGRSARVAIAGVLAAVLMASSVAYGPAVAEPYEDGAADWAGSRYADRPTTGWMSAGAGDRVHDIAQIGDRIYLAGSFSGIRWGSQGRVRARAHLIAVNRFTGEPDWSFDPRFDGPVFSLAVGAGGGRLYVGGAFTRVDGRDRRRIVALTPGGEVVAGWRSQARGGNVRALVATRTYLYVGGDFASVAGTARRGLARVHRATGRIDRAWNASAQGGAVLALEMPPSRNRLYVGGRFRSVNGWGNTDRLVALRTQEGRIDTGFGRQPGRDVFDLLADGRGRLWAALDGAGGRAELLDRGGRVLNAWDTDGDVQAVERIGDRVFFGGHELIGSAAVATVDYDSGRGWDDTFRPGIGGGDGVWAFHADGRQLWVGAQATGPFTGFARYPAG